MKTIFTKFLALSGIAVLMLASCKKDGALVTSNGGKPGSLTASTTTPVLDKTKLTDATAVISFTVSKADYGFSAAVTNTLQIDAAGDNWAKPTSVVLPATTLSQGYSTADFNSMVLKLNLPAGVASQVMVRVAHTLSATIAPVYSNVVTLTVTPFNLTSWVYVPGAYEGWGNPGPSEDSLVSVTGNGVYTGIINFTAGNNQFLITPKKTWDHKYATNDAQNTTSSTVTFDGPNNFYAPAAAGQYWVTLNTNTNTITFAAADYYSVIGDAAQGWSTDVDMKYVNDGNLNWVLKAPLVSTGAFKVRKNHDWGISYGVPKTSPPPGVLNNTTNDNIPVPVSGTYVVTFATSKTDNTLATYTLTKQ